MPPSTTNPEPVTKDDSSDSRKAMARGDLDGIGDARNDIALIAKAELLGAPGRFHSSLGHARVDRADDRGR